MSISKYLAFLILLTLSLGCATYKAHFSNQDIIISDKNPSEIQHSFYLIGDAGNSNMGSTSAALQYLEKHIEEAPKNATLLFLGDNIYDRGFPKKQTKAYPLAKHRIQSQTDIAKKFAGTPIFIPGNHDWYHGLGGLKRQEKFIEKTLGKKEFFPRKRLSIKKSNYF